MFLGSLGSLSCCFFYPRPSLVSPAPALINILYSQSHLGLYYEIFLHEVKNPQTTDQPEADPLRTRSPFWYQGDSGRFHRGGDAGTRKVSADGWRVRESCPFQAAGVRMQRGMEVFSSQHTGYGESKASRWERAGGPDCTLAFILQRIMNHRKKLRANLSREGLGCQVTDGQGRLG